MTRYRLVAEPQADLDIAAAVDWYENEQLGLSLEFLDELRTTYNRIVEARSSTSISDPEFGELWCATSLCRVLCGRGTM